MLTIMIEVGECTNGTIDQRGLNKFLKNAGLTAATVKKKCQECYESGLKGAVMIVKQKGPDAYCATMKQLYGPKGTQFPGLMK